MEVFPKKCAKEKNLSIFSQFLRSPCSLEMRITASPQKGSFSGLHICYMPRLSWHLAKGKDLVQKDFQLMTEKNNRYSKEKKLCRI